MAPWRISRSQPILMGLLNGVAITIMVGQLARIFGFDFQQRGLIERLAHVPEAVAQTHWPTVGVSALTLLSMVLILRWRPRWPATLLALVICVAVSYQFDLARLGRSDTRSAL